MLEVQAPLASYAVHRQQQPQQRDSDHRRGECEREGDPEEVLCRMDNVSNPRTLDITLHNLMREYLAAFSPVSPKVEGRITATDVPKNLLSQLEGYDYEFI